MFVLSCEPATGAIPEWHKEHFRGKEDIVSSNEGWAPGSLNLAQAFSTRLHTLLAHGDITRLLIDLSCRPDDPERFSRFSKMLNDEQRRKLDERNHTIYLNVLRQRIRTEQSRNGKAIHLSIRTEQRAGMATVELKHDPSLDTESTFVRLWADALRLAAPDLAVSVEVDPNYGLSTVLREAFPTDFGSISVVVDQAAFLDGKPLPWAQLKKHLLETLPKSL